MRLFNSKPVVVILLLTIVATLSACGGGGGSDASPAPAVTATPSPTPAPTPTPTSNVLTGVFIDSAVQGLTYTTLSQSGTTNENGEFLYVTGEEVTFSIGDIVFPAVTAKDMISPLDVFSVTDINDVRVENMARFLQTLDIDGVPGNGITIPAEAHNQATGVSVDFSATNFEQQVMDVVANSGAMQTSLIGATEAREHLNLTLGNMLALSRNCGVDTLKMGYTGTFSTLQHGVSGRVTVMDNCTLEVTMFNFDGNAPNVQFYTGDNLNFSGSNSFAIGPRLDGRPFNNETIIVPLPNGLRVDDFNSLSVWCIDFRIDFGSVVLEKP